MSRSKLQPQRGFTAFSKSFPIQSMRSVVHCVINSDTRSLEFIVTLLVGNLSLMQTATQNPIITYCSDISAVCDWRLVWSTGCIKWFLENHDCDQETRTVIL